MFKRMVHIYSIDHLINQFPIGYMFNSSLHVKKVFREKVEKCLNATFHENKMKTIRDVLNKNNTCVIALIMFYENKGIKPKQIYRALGCVFNALVENYVYIDYLRCHMYIFAMKKI